VTIGTSLGTYRCSDPTKEDPVEDREKVRSGEPDDVEAHKKSKPVAMGNEEAPTEGESGDDDVELHRSKSQAQKL
jgi:hypothetical protein